MSDFDLLQLASDYPPDSKVREMVDEPTGFRILLSRGMLGFCCYLGVPAEYLLAGVEDLRITCHDGITFQAWGEEGSLWAPGWYWWGWDYQHAGDLWDIEGAFAGLGPEGQALAARFERLLQPAGGFPRKEWTVDAILQEARAAAQQLKEQLLEAHACTDLALQALGAAAARPPT